MPVSLLRVRPALGTALAQRAAHDLDHLLQLRLVREPSLFVLERDNLRVMDEEVRWAGEEFGFSGRGATCWKARWPRRGGHQRDHLPGTSRPPDATPVLPRPLGPGVGNDGQAATVGRSHGCPSP